MKNANFKIAGFVGLLIVLSFFSPYASAQYKSFILSPKGDTLNVVDKNNLKQGRWVISVVELRGEPGYDEEGYFKDDKKTGPWRRYNSTGDILAVENYKAGGKEGVQEYFTFLGDLIRHEEWKGYDPNSPYDTIAVYGQGNNEVSTYKIVKAEQYSVPNGVWKYYAPGEKFIKAETYDHGRLLKADNNTAVVAKKAADVTGETGKTKEILEYEKKYSKKKRKQMEREGKTSL
ncbi:MAG: hypothetical protein ABIU77_25035 [Ferruginibacter sp.]|jgi:antitoxin component YwqK of YwqJK toxin-antitoxin module